VAVRGVSALTIELSEAAEFARRRGAGSVPVALLAFSILFVIALPGGSQAGEQELEEAPAPAAVEGITSALERAFTAPARKESLFPSLTRALDKLPPFFADTEFEARYRTYYLRKDRTVGILSEAWAMGGSVHYKSGWLADLFALEAEFFTSQPIIAPHDRAGTFLLAPVQDGYSVVGVANAKLRHSGLVLTGYRQSLSLPYVNRSDSRMAPNTFEALMLEKNEGPLRFTTGYVWKIKPKFSDKFIDMAKVVGVDRKRGLAYAGFFYQPVDHFSFGASAGVVPDLMLGLYGESAYATSLTESIELRVETQLTYQQSVGEELLFDSSFKSWNLGLRLSSSWKGWVARLGASITGDGGLIISPYGSSPSYVDFMQRTFNRADEKALLVSLSYDFSDIGVPGLSAIANFAQGWQGIDFDGRRDASEIDFTVDYRFQGKFKIFQGLWLRLRASWLHVEGRDHDGSDVRVIVQYNFPIL
jgi:hypothetical protein